jgi:hypothetical protein
MPDRSRKRPRDPNQLAKAIVDIATGQLEDRETLSEERTKNPAAVALGRLGGLKGARARAESLSPTKRKSIARQAAFARWKKVKEPK